MSIQSLIQDLATKFASDVLDAVRSVSLEELAAVTKSSVPSAVELPSTKSLPRSSKRLGRRTQREIDKVVDRIVSLLGQHPKGLRAEELRTLLAIHRKELPRPLADALAGHKIVKSGQKRATTYRLVGGKAAAKKPTVKAATKPAKASAKPVKKSVAKATKPAKKASAKPAKKASAPVTAPPAPAANGAAHP
jgi:hypothetical protein